METNHSIILRQAFINMGYRRMEENECIWGKPVGFGIIIAQIKEENIEFSTMFTNFKSESNIWATSTINLKELTEGSEGEEFYNKCVHMIAYKEFESNAEKLFFPVKGLESKTFDFRNS